MARKFRFAWLLALTLVPAPARSEEFFFKNGDHVVMMGDSITEQHLYSNYVEMWTVTRFPSWNITFRNVGIGGDRSPGGNGRFKRDVLPYKATAMTVDFGMNDGGYKPFDTKTFDVYVNGLKGIADQAKSADVRVAWVTPQPLDTAEPGHTALTEYNLTLNKYSDGVHDIAEKNHGLFVDQFHPYLAVLDKARAKSPKYERITAGDAVHPGPPGQALMAFGILKGLGFPTLVSSVEIDLSKPDDVKTTNCKISKIHEVGGAIRFERTDAALPFFPDESRPILKWAPILDELNAYTLKVVGLKPGHHYELTLENKKVAKYTAEELANGVNLADAALTVGPIADQVKAVKAAVEAKNRFHHDKIYRGVVLSQVSLPEWLGVEMTSEQIETKRKAVVETRLAELPPLDLAVRKALAPKPHLVVLTPVAN